ncbi:hypothetical protein B296_00020728 [Ensete ventricosum]|uniref:Uncharacterized protein n=1 Tax=Ensete ventricosum TaxID=4639 RepID=A0A426YTM5_ENSVE|nr:hypothetical protein B296_00020728 [Ensete ventricosum]
MPRHRRSHALALLHPHCASAIVTIGDRAGRDRQPLPGIALQTAVPAGGYCPYERSPTGCCLYKQSLAGWP